jgi:hypothetical protein
MICEKDPPGAGSKGLPFGPPAFGRLLSATRRVAYSGTKVRDGTDQHPQYSPRPFKNPGYVLKDFLDDEDENESALDDKIG